MKPTFSPIRITIIDFVASFLPGLVWLALILTGVKLLYTPILSTNSQAIDLIPSLMFKKDISKQIAIVISSFLIGYCIDKFATSVIEHIAFIDRSIMALIHKKFRFDDFHFPYNSEFSKRDFFHIVDLNLQELVGFNWRCLPGNQPFSSCKRILKIIQPEFWSECEVLEAVTRMFGSLSLASIVIFLAIISDRIRAFVFSTMSYFPIFCMLIICFIIIYCFRKHRQREVKYAYMNFIIATSITNIELDRFIDE